MQDFCSMASNWVFDNQNLAESTRFDSKATLPRIIGDAQSGMFRHIAKVSVGSVEQMCRRGTDLPAHNENGGR